MKQVGALVGAIVMIVASLWIRDQVTGTDNDAAVPCIGADCTVDPAAGSSVVCAIDLRTTCGTEDTTFAGAGATADRLLADGAAALDGTVWVTTQAWVDAVESERQRLGQLPALGEPQLVAESPVTIAIWEASSAELSTACGTVDWFCLAGKSGEALDSGGRVSVGMPPASSATGLLVAASQSGGLLGATDYASNDFDPAFASAARALGANQQQDPLTLMRSRGPGALTAVGIVRAASTPSRNSNFGTIVDIAPEPAVLARVVVVGPAGTTPPTALSERLRRQFTDAGWDAVVDASVPDGLPDGGVLAAVRSLWSDR